MAHGARVRRCTTRSNNNKKFFHLFEFNHFIGYVSSSRRPADAIAADIVGLFPMHTPLVELAMRSIQTISNGAVDLSPSSLDSTRLSTLYSCCDAIIPIAFIVIVLLPSQLANFMRRAVHVRCIATRVRHVSLNYLLLLFRMYEIGAHFIKIAFIKSDKCQNV